MKKTQIFSSIIILLSLIFILVGCKKKETKNVYSIDTKVTVDGKVHENEVKEMDDSFIKNGSTEYKIVVPKNSDETDLAVTEFKLFFEEATGIVLEVVKDEGITYTENSKYISFGETELVKQAGLIVPKSELGQQGYIIKTIGKSIFVCGRKLGNLYGAYQLLHELFEYECYTNKVTYILKNVTDLNLLNLSIKEIPDILYRVASDGTQYLDNVSRRRMRLVHTSEIFCKSGDVHNVLLNIVPLNETNLVNHPDWFANDREQLCYTAHGNSDEYALMVEEAVSNCKTIIEEEEKDVISITQMDINVWCSCDTCKALKNKYGTDAASQIMFVNDVAEEIENWLKIEHPDRDIQFVIFAYHKTETAPASKNELGEWKPIDENVILRDNVSIWVAPISSNYFESVHSDINISMKQAMEAWRVCASSYFFWGYNSYYGTYLIPFDSYGGMQDLIKYCVSLNTVLMFPQGKYNTSQNTGFDDLKDYLYAKLMWNCNADINELISDFFNKVYREAASDMEEAFWSWRVMNEIQDEMGRDGSHWTDLKNTKYWTKQFFVNMLESYSKAQEKIEKYKTIDIDVYNAISDSIACETIFPRYMLCEVYSSTFSTDELAKMKSELKIDIERLRFTRISENVDMASFLAGY